MATEKEIAEQYVKSFGTKISRNLNILDRLELGTKKMLHISPNKNLGEIKPRLSHRQGTVEDRTVPRISASVSLLGCIMGHNAIVEMFEANEALTKEKYHGGLKIYSFDFDVTFKPNNLIAPDAENTDEYWLLAYDRNHSTYKAVEIGEFFISSIQKFGCDNDLPNVDIKIYIAVENDIMLDNNYVLKAGAKYVIEMPAPCYLLSVDNLEGVYVNKISDGEYFKYKGYCASTLSFSSPQWINWGNTK